MKRKKKSRTTKCLTAIYLQYLALVVGDLDDSRASNRVFIGYCGVGAGDDDIGLSIDALGNLDRIFAIRHLGLNKERSEGGDESGIDAVIVSISSEDL